VDEQYRCDHDDDDTPHADDRPSAARRLFRKLLALAVPFSANIGGIGTPIASPPNAVAIGFLQKVGFQFGFLEWMIVAVPLMLGLLVFAWLLLWQLSQPAARNLRIEHPSERLTACGWFVAARSRSATICSCAYHC